MSHIDLPRSTRLRKLLAGVALLSVFGLVAAQGTKDTPAAKDAKPAAANQYIGAEKCKSCHQAEAAGGQYTLWQKTPHAKAFERLASDEAKALAKKAGIEDPQKSDKCLKCHVTAFGVAAEGIKKGFDPKGGVQCESCHGPGDKHMKARFAAAMNAPADDKAAAAAPAAIPEGEIITTVDEKTCVTCHNSESPSYKPFCFCENFAKIYHPDPRKKEKKEFTCSCDKCKAANGGKPGKCSFPAAEKK